MTPPTPRSGAYRPDIDGLRAVAVLSVVLYHLHKPLVPGGFVGVDIFFVISGYLITRNIWTELEAGHFSLRAFYLRRIRRIAPAFLVMTAVTLAAGAVLLVPDDLARLGASSASAALSASNVYFWRSLDTSYFAESSEQEPLLHTWSLGVEEQFYLLWPAALLVVALLPRRRLAALGGAVLILVASFAIGQLTLESAPKFAYFMLPARAGELMMGAVLALRVAPRRDESTSAGAGRPPVAVRELAGLAGFGLIAWALTQLDGSSPFPGVNAIFPSLGAALVMLAGGWGSVVVNRLLTPAPMVFVGLISYSLYLWHWPILAYLRYFYANLEPIHIAVAVPAMFALAIASYRLVELPARTWRAPPRRQAIRLFLVPAGALLVVAGAVAVTDGLRPLIELSPSVRAGLAAHEATTKSAFSFPYNCQLIGHDPDILEEERCVVGAADGGSGGATDPDVLLWGDSQAAHFIGVIGGIAEPRGLSFRNASHSACPPLFGGSWSEPPYRTGCDAFRELVQEAVLAGRFRTVFMGAAWTQYDRDPDFRPDLERTLDAITGAGVEVVILGQVPRFPDYQRGCTARVLRVPVVDCRGRAVMADAGESRTNSYLASLADARPAVSYLSIRDVVCRDGRCEPYVDDEPAYFDTGHLSMDGSWRIGRLLARSPGGSAWRAALEGSSASSR